MCQTLARSMGLSTYCLAIIGAFVICCETATAQDQDQLQELWWKKVPEDTKCFSDWLKPRMMGYNSSYTSRITQNEKPLTLHTRRVLKRKGSFYLFSLEQNSADPANTDDCHGINSKYAFRLKKSKNGSDWVIQNVVEATPEFDEKNLGDTMSFFFGADGAKADGFRNFIDMVLNKDITVQLIPNGKEIEPWRIKEIPGFRLHSISTAGPRQNILHVVCDYEVADAKSKKNVVVNSQFDFDLEAKCYPVKSHQVLKVSEEETILDWSRDLTRVKENEYELKSLSRFSQIRGPLTPRFNEIKEEAVISINDLPESDFTLSAFGLPEPPGIEWKKPFPWYLVFAGVGTVCLGVFFFLRSRAKRLRV